MFDFSFSEIALIGVVALVVIGPERLPRVARTAGVVLGRMQRYAATVRADIAREVELSELRRVQTDIQDAARALEHGVRDSLTSAEQQLDAGRQALMSGPPAALAEAGGGIEPAVLATPATTLATVPAAMPLTTEPATPSSAVAPTLPEAPPAAAPSAAPAQAGLFSPHETPPGPSA